MDFFGEKEMVAGSSFLLQHHKQLQFITETRQGIEAPLIITLFLPALNPSLVELLEGVEELC